MHSTAWQYERCVPVRCDATQCEGATLVVTRNESNVWQYEQCRTMCGVAAQCVGATLVVACIVTQCESMWGIVGDDADGMGTHVGCPYQCGA